MKISSITLLCLSLVASSVLAAEPAAEAPAAGAATKYDKAQLLQAFDGAMTCSAVTALAAEKTPPAEAWLWGNRSFAFGMLAVRFYTEANKKQITSEELNNILTEYANRLNTMPAADFKPFDEGCARKYPDIDKLCEQNKCPRQPPGADESAASEPAAGADGAPPAKE